MNTFPADNQCLQYEHLMDGIENEHDVYRDEDCMKKFGESIREHAIKIINFEKKKIILLPSKDYESNLNQENCPICKENFKHKYTTDKNYFKVRDPCHYTGR